MLHVSGQHDVYFLSKRWYSLILILFLMCLTCRSSFPIGLYSWQVVNGVVDVVVWLTGRRCFCVIDRSLVSQLHKLQSLVGKVRPTSVQSTGSCLMVSVQRFLTALINYMYVWAFKFFFFSVVGETLLRRRKIWVRRKASLSWLFQRVHRGSPLHVP